MAKLAKRAIDSCVVGGRSNSARRAMVQAFARAKAPAPVVRIEKSDGLTKISFPPDWYTQNGHSDSKPDL